MPINDSSLYIMCNAVADFVRSGLQTNANEMAVYIGSPAGLVQKKDENRINLFFYRFEPSGFQASAHPHEPWQVRMYCMVTCLAAEQNVDPGENDIRMLGQILTLFHEQRILPAVSIGDQVVRLLAVFNPASDEQLNQLWSIQGDLSYRPSVIYELALAPVMPQTLRGTPPKVGALGFEAGANLEHRFDEFSGISKAPLVPEQQVNALNPAWIPVISWVENEHCVSSIEIDVEATPPATVSPDIWVAGVVGESISFEWQVWQGDDWQIITGDDLIISSNQIVHDNIPLSLPTVTLPALAVDADHDRWQLLVTATRIYQPSPDAFAIRLRSNPLLISLYRGSLL